MSAAFLVISALELLDRHEESSPEKLADELLELRRLLLELQHVLSLRTVPAAIRKFE